MDVPLYAIALAAFAVLYLALNVFLAYVLLITLLIMFLYIVLRHGRLPEDYPYGPRDISITMIFIGVTWTIFTFLAPRNPIPFIGNGFTYTSAGFISLSAVIEIAIVATVAFLVIFSFLAESDHGNQGMGVGSTEKTKQGVGSGKAGRRPDLGQGRSDLTH